MIMVEMSYFCRQSVSQIGLKIVANCSHPNEILALKIDAGLVSQEWRPALRGNLRRLYIDDINIDDIRFGQLLSVRNE